MQMVLRDLIYSMAADSDPVGRGVTRGKIGLLSKVSGYTQEWEATCPILKGRRLALGFLLLGHVKPGLPLRACLLPSLPQCTPFSRLFGFRESPLPWLKGDISSGRLTGDKITERLPVTISQDDSKFLPWALRASGDRANIICALSRDRGGLVPKWWNWQTRGVQGAVSESSCGFKSHLRHQIANQPGRLQRLGV